MKNSKPVNLESLAEKVIERASHKKRFIFSISGPPGSGKSTLADKLKNLIIDKYSTSCEVITMDGFHYDNHVLEEQNLLAKKGAPNTFDLSSFNHFLSLTKLNKSTLFAPVFDRSKDTVIKNKIEIRSNTHIILVEGNYLLLNNLGWQDLSKHFDMNLYLDVPIEILRKRLIKRWLDQNLDIATANFKVETNDLPNALKVIEQSMPADFVLRSA